MSGKRIPFVIYSAQRSGSTLLIHLLDQHSEITCSGEIFKLKDCDNILHPEYSFGYEDKSRSARFKLFPSSVIRKHLHSIHSPEGSLFGFKLMISQTDKMMQIPRILVEEGYRMIVLRRKSILDQSLSVEMAKASDKWVNKGGEEYRPVELDLERLDKSIRYFERCDQELERVSEGQDAMELQYESFSDDIQKTLTEVFTFLGVDPSFQAEVNLKRSSEKAYSERISNYTELRSFLNERGYTELPG